MADTTLISTEAGRWAAAAGVNTLLMGLAFISPKKLLTPAGYLHAWVLGVLV